MQKADFAAQHLHQVTLPTSTHLHLPQVIGVTCAILRTGKKVEMCFKLGDVQIHNDTQSESYVLLRLKSAVLCYGPTHYAIACNLEVFLGQGGLMEVTVKVTGCSERTRKIYIIEKNMHIII